MHRKYIDKLLEALNGTEFNDSSGLPLDYEQAMQAIVDFISDIKYAGKHVFFIGNGGSSAIASHMTADYMKNGGMKTYSLYNSAVTTCIGNDYGYQAVFSKPLSLLADKGDLLVAISSSGNSENVINAINVARQKELKIITFSGFHRNNGIIKLGDYNIYVPIEHYGIVESIHNLLLQQIVDIIADRDGALL